MYVVYMGNIYESTFFNYNYESWSVLFAMHRNNLLERSILKLKVAKEMFSYLKESSYSTIFIYYICI